jgi:hypothetical protein
MFLQLDPVFGKNYKEGQVYFVYSTKEPYSKGISFFTYNKEERNNIVGTPTHCGICIGENTGIAALDDGVIFEDLGKIFQDKNKRIFFREPILFDEETRNLILTYCKYLLGIEYDWKLAAGIGICNTTLVRTLLSPVKIKKLLQKFNSEDKLICSEFVMYVMYHAEVTTDNDFLRTPREVFEHRMFKEWKKNL